MNPINCCILPWPLVLFNVLVSGFVIPPPPVPLPKLGGQLEPLKDNNYGEMSSGDSSNSLNKPRYPRSCSHDFIVKTYFEACSFKNYKKKRSIPPSSSAPTLSSLLSPPNPPKHQLVPISINVVVVDYFIHPPSSSGTSSSLPIFPLWSQHLLQNEPISNHINGGNFPPPPPPPILGGLTMPPPMTTIWFDDYIFGGVEGEDDEWMVTLQTMYNIPPELKKERATAIVAKCCSSGGCAEKDFHNLCFS